MFNKRIPQKPLPKTRTLKLSSEKVFVDQTETVKESAKTALFNSVSRKLVKDCSKNAKRAVVPIIVLTTVMIVKRSVLTVSKSAS